VNPSNPAQYFHALRRQALAPHLKPMVVLSPKFLLHHRPCNSPLDDFGPGTRFRAVIADGDEGDNCQPREGGAGAGAGAGVGRRGAAAAEAAAEAAGARRRQDVRRVVMCSGKVFYALHQARRAKKATHDVALVRVEQLFPFPHEALAGRLGRYPNAELIWCQEEPKNMGFWWGGGRLPLRIRHR
jgi:2-oxoglutarate dehydrogenase E1 component